MVKHIEHDVAYFYDSNPTEEDLVSESTIHRKLVIYLGLVLEWLLRGQDCTLYGNLKFYHTSDSDEKPLAPDIALVKGGGFQDVRSWRIGTTGPAPQLVFEMASAETWDKDLDEKPDLYALMGAQEYFAYDPNEPLLKKGTPQRLYGWQLDKATGRMEPMPVGPDGRLWSPLLESFLVPDGQYLRLYDSNGYLCLTEAEAQAQAKRAQERRADAATKRADAATRRADAEAKAKEVLAEKLRSLGIDPNQL